MSRKKKSRKKSKGKRKRIDWSKIRWGTLTKWCYRHRSEIKRKYGDPFRVNRNGRVELNDRVLRKLVKDEEFLKKLSGTHWKRIKKKIQFKLNVLGG